MNTAMALTHHCCTFFSSFSALLHRYCNVTDTSSLHLLSFLLILSSSSSFQGLPRTVQVYSLLSSFSLLCHHICLLPGSNVSLVKSSELITLCFLLLMYLVDLTAPFYWMLTPSCFNSSIQIVIIRDLYKWLS